MKPSLAAGAFALLAACRPAAPPLPDFGAVPSFQLTDQNGRPFSPAQLAGHAWVADFIYTSCPGICPRMTSQMHEVQDSIATLPEVRLVSFSVDPAIDTPERLNAYARLHRAKDGVWFFLTGSQQTLRKLDRDAFKLGNIDASLQHSSRFVLIDGHMRIRGYFDTSSADSIPRLIAGIQQLESQNR